MTKEEKKAENDASFRRGFHFAWGVLCLVGLCLFGGTVIDYAGRSMFGYGVDDCDAGPWHKCGATVVKDAKTGKEWLAFPNGGVVAR